MGTDLSPRHLYESNKNSKRVVTEEWLERKIETLNIKFRYFLTLSFTFQQRNVLNQYLDNQHIKKVILDFFYPNRKPTTGLDYGSLLKHIPQEHYIFISLWKVWMD